MKKWANLTAFAIDGAEALQLELFLSVKDRYLIYLQFSLRFLFLDLGHSLKESLSLWQLGS